MREGKRAEAESLKAQSKQASERAKDTVAFIKDKGYPCLIASALTGEGVDGILDEIIRDLDG